MSYIDHGVKSQPEPNPEQAIQPETRNELHRRDGADPSERDRPFHWLKKCFTDCFGLPTEMYKRRKLISFDGVELAKGYNRVVATWQGLFYEFRDEDINFRDLKPGFNTAQGISTLYTKGVTIFKLSRDDTRTTPRPHRFAVIPRGNPDTPCNPLKVGVWYAHVYQTKIELNGFFKTLNSKAIARNLQKKWGLRYLHRSRDIEQALPPNSQTFQNITHPPESYPTRSIAINTQQNPQREHPRLNHPPVTDQLQSNPTIAFKPSGLNLTAQQQLPLASKPPPSFSKGTTHPHTLQNPWMPLYPWQNQWPLPQQLPQPQPPLQFQPAHFTQLSVPNYHYPHTIVPPVPTYGQACTTMPRLQQQASIPTHAQTVNPQYNHNTTPNHTDQPADRSNLQQPFSSRVHSLNLPPRVTTIPYAPAGA